MNESERAIRQLIDDVLGLAEATRATAAGEGQDLRQLDDLASRTEAVARRVSCLKALVQAEVKGVAPATPIPKSAQIVESLDDIFGSL